MKVKSWKNFRTKLAQQAANGPVWMPQIHKSLGVIIFETYSKTSHFRARARPISRLPATNGEWRGRSPFDVWLYRLFSKLKVRWRMINVAFYNRSDFKFGCQCVFHASSSTEMCTSEYNEGCSHWKFNLSSPQVRRRPIANGLCPRRGSRERGHHRLQRFPHIHGRHDFVLLLVVVNNVRLRADIPSAG